MPSVLGHKVDDAMKQIGSLSKNLDEQISTDKMKVLLSTAKTTMEFAETFAKYAAAATSIFAVTKILIGLEAEGFLRNAAREMNASLKQLCEAATVSTNLQHQEKFAKHVYQFVRYQIRLHARDDSFEIDAMTGPIGLVSRSIGLASKPVTHDCPEKPANYFFVYHPASDWHPAFHDMIRSNPLPGFVGACNNLNALGVFLSTFRKAVGSEAVIHILLPSAHMYVLPEEILVSADILPLRMTGQMHMSNQPYCHATITGLDACDVREIGMLPKPKDVDIATTAGAVAAGIGTGLASGTAALVAGDLLLCLLCPPAGAAAAAGVLAIVVGSLGVGATTGTVVGTSIFDKARWK